MFALIWHIAKNREESAKDPPGASTELHTTKNREEPATNQAHQGFPKHIKLEFAQHSQPQSNAFIKTALA